MIDPEQFVKHVCVCVCVCHYLSAAAASLRCCGCCVLSVEDSALLSANCSVTAFSRALRYPSRVVVVVWRREGEGERKRGEREREEEEKKEKRMGKTGEW